MPSTAGCISITRSIKMRGMDLGRLLIIAGIVLLGCGLLIHYSQSLSFLKLGRLPGDIRITRENFTFYFPLTTCIIVSILLTLVFYFFRK